MITVRPLGRIRWAGPMGRAGVGALGPVGAGVVTLLAIESATDMVGRRPRARRRGFGRAGARGGRAHAELLAPADGGGVRGVRVHDRGHRRDRGRRRTRTVHRTPGRGGHRQGPGPGPGRGCGRGEQPGHPGRRRPRWRSVPDPVRGDRRVVSVVDARRGEVFAAAYRSGSRAGADRRRSPVRRLRRAADDRPRGADRPERRSDVLVAWLVERGPAGSRWWATVPSATTSSWRPRPGSTSARATELSAPPPLALARLALPPARRAGRHRRPPATWCPTTAGRPTPGSTGSSVPRVARRPVPGAR